ncbi:MAG: FtsX-like permease family protein [Acidaminobacteraceae bacterium]
MGILIKFTLRNIKEHKFRTFLIILSITLSVALFFGSFSISDSITGMFMDNMKSYFGSAEVIVSAGQRNESGMVKVKDLGDVSNKFSYQVPSSESGSKYKGLDKKKVDVSLKGFNLDELQKLNPVIFMGEGVIENSFIGKQVIIGEKFARKNKLKKGDSIRLIFSEDVKFFKVVAIAENKGFFKTSVFGGNDAITMITPLSLIQKFQGSNTGVNGIYLKSTNDIKIDEYIKDLKTVYKDENVQKTITKSEIDSMIKPIRYPFMFMLLLVVIISIFIIYTSFKVIMLERLPMLGTFRSIGATKRMTNTLMLSESIIYGVIGSSIGTFLGIGVLKALMALMAMGMGEAVAVSYPAKNIFIALTFGLGLSFFSALVPIIKTTNIPVKEILLNIIEGTKKKRKNLRYIFGLISGVLAFILPRVVTKGAAAAAAGGVGVVLVIITMILFIPLLTDFMLRFTEKLFGMLFGNIGLLASKNLKGNKSTYDNLVLLTIGLTSIIAISVLGQSIEKDMFSEFNNANYQIEGYTYDETGTTFQRLLVVPGIKDIERKSAAWQPFKYKDDGKFLTQLEGVSTEKYFEMMNYDVIGTDRDDDIYKDLLEGRKLILSTQVRDKYKLSLNQEIELKTAAGNRTYKIIGFIQTKKGQGSFGLTSIKNFKYDLKSFGDLEFIITTQEGVNPESIVDIIKEKFKKNDYMEVKTLASKKEEYSRENKGIIMILSVFSYATALIGSVGVMNNFMVSFISRRKSLAVMTSVGMSKKQRKQMIYIEAIAAGFLGGILGIISGQIVLVMVKNLLKVIELNLDMSLTLSFALIGMLGAVIVCLVSSLGVVRRSARLSVLEELKYE